MATMDAVKLHGGEPANFLDVGGGASAEQVAKAFGLVTADPNVRAILINIFGGITRGDVVAEGIRRGARPGRRSTVPIVVRLAGTNAEEGRRDPGRRRYDRGRHDGRSRRAASPRPRPRVEQ